MDVLVYWLIRTGVFLGAYGLLWFAGWYDIFAVITALIVGWLVSYIAFPQLRRRATSQLDGWISRSEKGIDADAAAEDQEAEDREAQENAAVAGKGEPLEGESKA